MTPEELDKLAALVKAATPGVWIDMGDTEPYPGCIVSSDDERDRLTIVLRDAEMDDRPEDRACTAALHNAAPALIAAARDLHTLQIGVGHPMWLPSVADALEMDEPFAATSGDVLERVRALAREVERLRAFVPVWRWMDNGKTCRLWSMGIVVAMLFVKDDGVRWTNNRGDDGQEPDLPTAAATVCARLGIPSVEVPDAE